MAASWTIRFSNSQASSARVLLRRRGACLLDPRKQSGGAERRKTHRWILHRTQPSVLTSPGGAGRALPGIVATDAENAHARRRSTAAILGLGTVLPGSGQGA